MLCKYSMRCGLASSVKSVLRLQFVEVFDQLIDVAATGCPRLACVYSRYDSLMFLSVKLAMCPDKTEKYDAISVNAVECSQVS